MARCEITDLATLAAIEDGRVNLQFGEHLRTILGDVMARPTCAKVRELTLTLAVAPEIDDQGEVVGVKSQVSFKAKSPAAQTRQFSMACLANKGQATGLVYNDMAPDDHRQATLDEQGGFQDSRGPGAE